MIFLPFILSMSIDGIPSECLLTKDFADCFQSSIRLTIEVPSVMHHVTVPAVITARAIANSCALAL